MPSQFVPHLSGRHRTACFALYKALLKQCLFIPIPAQLQPKQSTSSTKFSIQKLPSRPVVNPIKHLIRKQFRRNAIEHSPRIIVAALENGYEAEQLLRAAADGDLKSRNQIYDLLQHRQKEASTSSRIPQPPKPKIRYPEAIPGAPKLLETRPLPLEKLSGPRHVPKFSSTSQGNFLRIQKPQSPFLSRVLRDKITQKQRRIDSSNRIDDMRDTARMEDEWEDIVLDHMEEEGLDLDEWYKTQPGFDWGDGGWEKDILQVNSDLGQMMKEEAVKSAARSRKQINLVTAEKELWLKERAERRHEKNLAKRARKEKEKKDLDHNFSTF